MAEGIIKKLIFLIAGTLYSLTSFAQEVALNNAVSIDVPKGAQKISREQALAHDRKKFNNEERALSYYGNLRSKLYKVDDIVIKINAFDTTFKFKEGYAAYLKKGMDEMARGVPSYTSSLKIINNNSVVVTSSLIGDVVHCYFYCFNANNTRKMAGSLVYNKTDESKATAVLDHILNSVKFKD